MLEIRDLHVTLKKKYILKGINLVININEIHVLMGPNGSGKSTLSNVLVGSTHYTIRKGVIKLNGIALNSLSPDKRASLGLFLCFQYPVEIPGISNLQFLKVAINSIRKYQNKKKINYVIFMQNLKAYTKQLKMNSSIMSRGVNEGFSGGEKKKNEILQMMVLKPSFCILDEIDSGLDIDSLKIVANSINNLKNQRGLLIITHYQRLLQYIKPTKVHILLDGKIKKSGTKSLILKLEEKGYAWLKNEK